MKISMTTIHCMPKGFICKYSGGVSPKAIRNSWNALTFDHRFISPTSSLNAVATRWYFELTKENFSESFSVLDCFPKYGISLS